ncbi:MAG TPA: hypothetical protein VFD58_10140 [Blastocatellia bacterium]|nr:hypothetical protein [Blastocatellia bacterium]
MLYAPDARTLKVLYNSGGLMEKRVHSSGLAVAGGHIHAADRESNA